LDGWKDIHARRVWGANYGLQGNHIPKRRPSSLAACVPDSGMIGKDGKMIKKMINRIGCWCALFLTCAAPALSAEYALMAPSVAARAGEELEIVLYMTNSSDAVAELTVPERLRVRLLTPQDGFDLDFNALSHAHFGTVVLAPQGFAKFSYKGRLPGNLAGPMTLEATGVRANPLVLMVAGPSVPAQVNAKAEGGGAAPAQKLTVDLPPLLSTYEPAYFSVGTRGGTNAKFQLSFKYRIFDSLWDTGITDHIYFGYTQTSIWDLETGSAPFRDTSYRPSLFYYRNDVAALGARAWLGLQGGAEHESNGKSGADSRSINTLFVRPVLFVGDLSKKHWMIAPKVWAYLDKSDNPDIADYRGYFDLLVKYGNENSWFVSSNLRKGARAGYGSIQLDGAYALTTSRQGRVGTYLHLQYFNGWGESILEYDQKLKSQFRIGVMLVP
jgi:phospholipase A1